MLTDLIIRNFRLLMSDVERAVLIFRNNFPPFDFGFTGIDYNERSDSIIAPKKFSIQDFMQENLVWAVQKKRRSIEKRLSRKYGQLDGYYKLIIKQKDLEVCVHCGHDKKRGYLCKNCYTKVMDETRSMQQRIIEELQLDPVDKEVIVLYKGEKERESQEFWEGKRIVEMPVERPAWFSRNLLQRTTTSTSDSTDVKPEQLG